MPHYRPSRTVRSLLGACTGFLLAAAGSLVVVRLTTSEEGVTGGWWWIGAGYVTVLTSLVLVPLGAFLAVRWRRLPGTARSTSS